MSRFLLCLSALSLIFGIGLSIDAHAGAILIINGASGTSEPSTTAAITSNLDMLHQAMGNSITIADSVPADLSPFNQIWDIRFSNNLPITGGQEAQFLAFLQGGGGMLVVGENSSFPTRNTSVLGLINAAGGGSLTFAVPNYRQTVLSPFDVPNLIGNGDVDYAAPGGVIPTLARGNTSQQTPLLALVRVLLGQLVI